MSIDKILEERGSYYGDPYQQFTVASELKGILDKYAPDMDGFYKEGLRMMLTKISRIINGKNLQYEDSYQDLMGYAKIMLMESKKRNAGLGAPDTDKPVDDAGGLDKTAVQEAEDSKMSMAEARRCMI